MTNAATQFSSDSRIDPSIELPPVEGNVPPPTTTVIDHDDYPEGGLQAWVVVLGAWCAMVPPMGLINSMNIFQAWFSENQLKGMPESNIGWIISTYAFLVTALGAQVGPIFDAYDTWKLVVPGSIGLVLSMVFLSLSTEFYQIFLSFGICGGLGASLLFNPAVSAIGHWFCKRRAFATGIACTAGGISGIAFSLIIQYLAPRIGFPWAMRIIALISAALLGVASLTLRKRLPAEPRARLLMDFSLFRQKDFAVTVCAVFFVEFAVFIPYAFISSYALYQGWSLQDSFLLNTVLNAGAIPGRMLPGYVADRIGAFNTMCVTSMACAVLVLGMWQTAGDSRAAIMAFTALFGFWSGAAISLAPVCISRVCKIEDYGKANGMAYFIASFGALIGIPIAGALLGAGHDHYQNLIIFGGSAYLLAFVWFVIARGVAGGWSFGWF
ncbi:major facilitator superfamily domain-containing protein [Microdochium trichocladiopsis]|uniref:Major facilitator superfamily domain-containing protein n=1 Tax=Microdochium trichocladiopsis TaxID=1682393 RepID=A0A9P8YLK6_9PEZI|nr:major facilitator superfamily domain-containing protein [Microdochium trichocladiopsis]KAH7041230.1 major facilitator superfamily domain-containing protein [Microdochium trichocladiopsis]